MKLKKLILKTFVMTCGFLSVASVTYANFDEIEEAILRGPKTAHFSHFVEESQEKTQGGHPITKTTYGGGNIVKTTFNDSWVVAEEGSSSLEQCAYVATTGGVCRIMEHFFVEGGVRVAQTYLVTSGRETTAIMRYRFLSPDYPVTLDVLERMLGLAFPEYLSYEGVPVNQILLLVDPAHTAHLGGVVQNHPGLQASPAA